MKYWLYCLGLICLVSFVNAGIGTNGLVAEFHFEGNCLDNRTLYNGTQVGTLLDTPGIIGNSRGQATQNDSNYCVVEDANALTPPTAITLNCWVKRNVHEQRHTIMAKYVASAGLREYFWDMNNNSGTPILTDFMTIGIGNATGSGFYYSDTVSDEVDSTSWMMVTAVWNKTVNSGHMDLYVNGSGATLQNDGYKTDDMLNATNKLLLFRHNSTGRSLNGYLDECTIWNRDLSSSEISQMYNDYVAGYRPEDAANATPRTHYYFSQANGSDSANCSLETPCKTIAKLNSISLSSGNYVLFECGSLWRTMIDEKPDIENGVIYGSYGACSGANKPAFYHSILANYTANWTYRYDLPGTGIWQLNYNPGVEVGNMQMSIGAYGIRIWNMSDLDDGGSPDGSKEYYFFSNRSSSTGDYAVFVYSYFGNPATHWGNIEIIYAPSNGLFDINNVNGFRFENLTIANSARHGINGANAYNGLIRYCNITNIGGQWYSGTNVRLGNGIEFWNDVHNITVENNTLSQILDAGLTAQGTGVGYEAHNLIFKYNVLTYVAYCFEFFSPSGSEAYDRIVDHNTCYSPSGYLNALNPEGFYVGQRFQGTFGGPKCIRYGSDRSATTDRNHTFTNNICYDTAEEWTGGGNAYMMNIHDYYNDYLNQDTFYSDYNLYSKYTEFAISYLAGTTYTNLTNWRSALGKDTNSIESAPMFTSDGIDLTPLPTSPACGAASDGSDIGAIPCGIADTTPPVVSLVYPTNNTNYQYFNGSVVFSLSEQGNCSLSTFTKLNNVSFYYAAPPGEYALDYICQDTAGNYANGTVAFVYSFISKDAYVDSSNPASNYGTNNLVQIGTNLGGDKFNGYFLLNFSTVPLSSDVTYARLFSVPYLYCADVYGCLDTNWNETGITWNTQNAEVNKATCTLIQSCVNNTASLNLSSYSETALAAGQNAFTLFFNSTSTTDFNYLLSKDYPITYTNLVSLTYSYFSLNYTSDISPPIVTQETYYFTTTSINLSFLTDESATCKYALVDAPYATMNWTATGTINHTLNFTASYGNNSLYISCNDTLGNAADATTNYDGWLYVFGAADCAVANDTIIYLGVYDEETPTSILTSEIELDATYYLAGVDGTFYLNRTLTGDTQYELCFGGDIIIDAYMKYNTSGSNIQRWFLINKSVANIENITMFSATDTYSDLVVTVRNGTTYGLYRGVYVELLRYYVGAGTWRVVQMAQADEYGQIFFYIREQDTDYKMRYKLSDTNVIYTSNILSFICSAGLCPVTMLLYGDTAENESTVAITGGFDNSSGLMYANWTSDQSETLLFTVTKETPSGSYVICNDTVVGTGGNYECDTSGHLGVLDLLVTKSNGESLLSKIYEAQSGTLGSLLGIAESAFMAFGLLLVCAMFGRYSPVGTIITTYSGLVIIYFLGLTTMVDLAFLMIAGAVGILLGWLIKQ